MNDLPGMLELADKLFEVNAIKFGAFKLKLHEKDPGAPLSPIYIDLRVLRSYPPILNMIASIFIEASAKLKLKHDLVADIPMSVSPIVAVISYRTKVPMITPRLEAKMRGTKASVLGAFQKGQIVLLIDDLVTQADSKLQAIQVLEYQGLIVKDVLVLVDCEQGGREQLTERGYTLHAVFELSELLQHYLGNGQIDQAKYDKVTAYLAKN